MGKRRSAGGLNPADAKKQLLRLFKTMFDKFGIMPDDMRKQDLEFFLLTRMADDNVTESMPMSYPEDVDFT